MFDVPTGLTQGSRTRIWRTSSPPVASPYGVDLSEQFGTTTDGTGFASLNPSINSQRRPLVSSPRNAGRRAVCALALALAACTTPTTVHAEPVPAQIAVDLAELFALVESVTGLSVAELPAPTIEQVGPSEFRRLCGRAVHGRPTAECMRFTKERAAIYLPEAINLREPTGQAELAHALTHYVQFKAGEYGRFKCPAEGETAAYAVGNAVLDRAGLMWTDHKPSPAHVRKAARC